MNYWYAARADEIFVDLDSRRSLNRAINVLALAAQDRGADPKLPRHKIYIYPTRTAGHSHLIVKLERSIGFDSRMAWSAWLGNDRLRLAYVLMRFCSSDVGYEDLLVSTKPYFRAHDSVCMCSGKHKEASVTDECPAMQELLGPYRSADYFYRTGPMKPAGKIRIPWGRISKRQLREWSSGKRKGFHERR